MAEAGDVTAKRTVAGSWMDLLAEEGHRPRLEVDLERPGLSVVAFGCEGSQFVLFLDEEDPTYYQLAVTYDTGGAGADGAALLHVANALNERAKVAKVVVDLEGEAASFLVEGFAESAPSPEVLRRSLYQLQRASDEFFERIRARRRPRAMA